METITEGRQMVRFAVMGLALFVAGCGTHKSTDDYLRQLKDADPVLRREAVREIADRDADLAIPALTESLRDENLYVRHDAAIALGKFGLSAAAAIPALTAALNDKEKSVRTSAAASLKKISPSTATKGNGP
jgi:HEAT repeat protein